MYFTGKRFAFSGALAAAVAVLLSGCNGAGSNVIGGIGNNNGYYRFINGSPDAGNVDVAIDGSQQNFLTGGVPYAGVTSYRGFSAGSHTITVYQAGNDTSAGQLYSQSISINAGSDVTVVLTGEKSPRSPSNVLGITFFNEQPFLASGGPYVDFHNAAPYVSGTTGLNQAVQFGYSFNGTNSNIGSPGNVGANTNPQGFNGQNVGGSASLSFYGNWTTGSATTNVQTVNPSCTTGLPCTTGNLSLYLVDGPGASATGSGAAGRFVGVFDNSGLITSSVLQK